MNETAAGIDVYGIVAGMIYFVLAGIALWGAWCVVMVWRRVAQKRFPNEMAQSDFLEAVEGPLSQKDFDGAAQLVEGDPRAMSQLIHLALTNRKIGYTKVRQLILDRFQRDVLADLDYRLSWVNTVIKSAPMVGLLGTVVGMMGAFNTLATSEKVETSALAGNISVALVTTACGLAIAIPLIMSTASINVRIRKMEDLVAAGMTRFLETYRYALGGKSREG